MNQHNIDASQTEVIHMKGNSLKQNEVINHAIEDDPEKFIGEFNYNGHIVYKNYLVGEGKQLRLYYTRCSPQGQARASIAIIHGFGEHSGRFMHIADYYATQQFEVHLIDLRGFGYSGGARGCATLPQLLQDVKILLQQVNPNLPLFIYGHSMGGLIVLQFALLNPAIQIAGVIATSPLLGFPSDRKLDWFKLKFVTSAGKKLEDMVINSMVNPTALTKNNMQLRHSFGDRLMIPFCGLNMAASILGQVQFMKDNAHLFTKPVLLLHGKQDAVTNYHDSVYFYEKCSSQEKGLKLFENGYHELQHDEECEDLKKITNDWILRRLEQAKILGNVPSIVNSTPLIKPSTLKWKVYLILIIAVCVYLYAKHRTLPKSLQQLLTRVMLFRK